MNSLSLVFQKLTHQYTALKLFPVNINPLVFFTRFQFFYNLDFQLLKSLLPKQQFYIIALDSWSCNTSFPYRQHRNDHIKWGIRKFKKMFPKVIIIGGYADEYEYQNTEYDVDMKMIFNHNCLIDEDKFVIHSNVLKQYDFIYNAAFTPYKRHDLCLDLQNGVFITYEPMSNNFRYEGKHLEDYYEFMIQQLQQHNTLPNMSISDYRFLDTHEICMYMNNSYCGLCLSSIEGAMGTSMEYLLCGLPVITTPNYGGRNYFLNTTNSFVINTNDELKDAIQFIKRNHDAMKSLDIRLDAITNITLMRKTVYITLKNLISLKTPYDEFYNILKDTDTQLKKPIYLYI